VHTFLPSSAASRNRNHVPVSIDGDEEVYDITRQAFPDRPSIASANSHFETTSVRVRRMSNNESKSETRSASVDEPEEEVYDITRKAFPDRPSIATANSHFETPSLRERRIRNKGRRSNSKFDANNQIIISSSETSGDDDAIGQTRVELEEKEARTEEKNRSVEERLTSRLAKEEEVAAREAVMTPTADLEEEGGEETAEPNKSDNAQHEDEQYEDITRSSFVDRPSLSSRAVHTFLPGSAARRNRNHAPVFIDVNEEVYDITRRAFADRPSIASVNSHFETTSLRERRMSNNESNSETRRASSDEPEEEVYDITRKAFPDRPSIATANSHFETPSLRERRRSNSTSIAKTRSSVSNSKPMKEITSPTSQPEPERSTKQNTLESATQAPRAELYELYIKRGFTNDQAQHLKDYFTTWTNGAKSHELKFTSIFTCPMTSESFACGNWRRDGISGSGQVAARADDEDQITYWYKTKKQAMSAAAAKALDSFALRECDGNTAVALLQNRCEDAPYMTNEDAPPLPILPSGISLPR